ncbi:MAG: sugar ABC transporter permease [Paenibacillaceae bacterium]|nr:sugar ABC transporter permease [Paenibacillaceae bacterium]
MSAKLTRNDAAAAGRARNVLRGWREPAWGYAFILPNLALIALFFLYPLFNTFRLSLFQANMSGETFIGLDNFKSLFADDVVLNSLKHTFYFALIIVPIIVALSFTVAGMMKDLRPSSKALFRIVFYLPVVSTPVVVTMIWAWMYNVNFGILNYLLSLLHLGPVQWLGTTSGAFFSIVIVVVTWSVGQPIILYLASMDGISKDLYEAAELDGAGPLRKFFAITLPLIANTTLFVSVTTTISTFQIFVVIHLLTRGGPYFSTETLVYTIYRTAFTSTEFGAASAQGVVLFVIIMVIALVQLRLIRSKA